jgi:hypothetical protein
MTFKGHVIVKFLTSRERVNNALQLPISNRSVQDAIRKEMVKTSPVIESEKYEDYSVVKSAHFVFCL